MEMEDDKLPVDELLKESILLNKKIAKDPSLPMKERALAELKLKKYFAALYLLYG